MARSWIIGLIIFGFTLPIGNTILKIMPSPLPRRMPALTEPRVTIFVSVKVNPRRFWERLTINPSKYGWQNRESSIFYGTGELVRCPATTKYHNECARIEKILECFPCFWMKCYVRVPTGIHKPATCAPMGIASRHLTILLAWILESLGYAFKIIGAVCNQGMEKRPMIDRKSVV